MKKYICCFTGHRPEKLGVTQAVLWPVLEAAIIKAINDGIRIFITGMSRGVDLWAAQIVCQQKQRHSDIHLICAIPFKDIELRWSAAWRETFYKVLEYADYIKVFSPEFSYASYDIRNRWMVDHSSHIIAVYNGSRGGTYNTLQYALRKQIEIRNIAI